MYLEILSQSPEFWFLFVFFQPSTTRRDSKQPFWLTGGPCPVAQPTRGCEATWKSKGCLIQCLMIDSDVIYIYTYVYIYIYGHPPQNPPKHQFHDVWQ